MEVFDKVYLLSKYNQKRWKLWKYLVKIAFFEKKREGIRLWKYLVNISALKVKLERRDYESNWWKFASLEGKSCIWMLN